MNHTGISLAAGLLAVYTTAVANTWTGTMNSDWNTPENWDPAAVPGVAVEAHLTATDKDYSVDYTNAMAAAEFGQLVVTNVAPYVTTLNLYAPGFVTKGATAFMNLGVNGRVVVWTNGVMESSCAANTDLTMRGRMTINGGSASLLSADSSALNGSDAQITLLSGRFTATASAGGNASSKKLRIIQGAALNVHGGIADLTCSAQVGHIGYTTPATVNMTGGTLILSRLRETDFVVGINNAPGSAAISGGSVTNFGSLWVGSDLYTSGSGSLTLSDGTWVQQNGRDVLLGRIRGTGTLTQSGGTFTTTGNTVLGSGTHTSNPFGRLYLDGGTYAATNAAGGATVTVRRGELRVSGGTLTVDKLFSDPDIYDGTSKSATLTFTAGTLNVGSLTVSNTVPLTVGNGTAAAALNLGNGAHRFKEAVTFKNNAVLGAGGTAVFQSGLVFETGAGLRIDGEDEARAPVDVQGTLTLPSAMVVDLSLGERSHPNELVLFTYDALSAPAGLAGVTFVNPANYKAVDDAANQRIVATYLPLGSVIVIR